MTPRYPVDCCFPFSLSLSHSHSPSLSILSTRFYFLCPSLLRRFQCLFLSEPTRSNSPVQQTRAHHGMPVRRNPPSSAAAPKTHVTLLVAHKEIHFLSTTGQKTTESYRTLTAATTSASGAAYFPTTPRFGAAVRRTRAICKDVHKATLRRHT
jgi:hypothetical protein